MEHILKKAIETAKKTEGLRNFKLGAVLFDKGVIVSAKGNCTKTHPALRYYTPWPILHAESRAILSHGLDNCHNLELMVVRINQTGDLTMSKPCKVCQELIKDVGIKRVWYSDWEGRIVSQMQDKEVGDYAYHPKHLSKV